MNVQGLTLNMADLRETLTSVSQIVNVGADLEGGTQLDVHGGHEMLLLQQQQGLSVNLLRQELGGELLAACEEEEEERKERVDEVSGWNVNKGGTKKWGRKQIKEQKFRSTNHFFHYLLIISPPTPKYKDIQFPVTEDKEKQHLRR